MSQSKHELGASDAALARNWIDDLVGWLRVVSAGNSRWCGCETCLNVTTRYHAESWKAVRR